MNIPIELWNIILTIRGHNLQIYKNCIRVNKNQFKIITNILNRIPNEIFINVDNIGRSVLKCKNCVDFECEPCCDMVDTDFPEKKWIDPYSYKYRKMKKLDCKNVNKITKNDILCSSYLKYSRLSAIAGIIIHIPLLITELFDVNCKQTCKIIELLYDCKSRHFYICYVKN